MTVSLKQIVLLVLIISTIGFFGYGYFEYVQTTEPESTEKIVQITFAVNYSQILPTAIQQYNVSNQQTAFEILVAHYQVNYTTYGNMGHFIDGINGVINNVNISNFYWIIYVNGEKSPIGADRIYPSANMIISFNYEPLS